MVALAVEARDGPGPLRGGSGIHGAGRSEERAPDRDRRTGNRGWRQDEAGRSPVQFHPLCEPLWL